MNAKIITKLEFLPKVNQHNVGLILYYGNMNYLYLRKYYSESLDQSVIGIIRSENGEK